MKRLISLLLAIALCLSLAACNSGTGNETYDYILHLLESEEYDMAIYLIEGLRDGKQTQQPAQQQVSVEQQQLPENTQRGNRIVELVPDCTGTDWNFVMELHNDTGHTITLESVVMIDYMDDQVGSTACFEGADLDILPLGRLVLENGQTVGWNDMRPTDYGFNRREYQHIFRDEQGGQILFSYIFDMRGVMNEGNNTPLAEQPAGDWRFAMTLENTGNSPWTLKSLEIINLMDGEATGTWFFEGEDLDNLGLGGFVLEPGQKEHWDDGHPAVSDWNGRAYIFRYVDGNDQEQSQTFHFEDLDKLNQPVDYTQDQGQDLKTLRHNADFEIEVSDGVFWVPAAELGSSRFSNMEIHKMLGSTPEDKQQIISTLYEALQLYQVGNFTASDDNVRIMENGINWEHHKPGYHAVRTNTGCCATDSNWLRYILDGDYEEVGYIATSQRDGSGHIFNYILHEDWYYIIDLTHYRATDIMSATEDGELNSYYATDFIAGNIHKTQNIQNYVNYIQNVYNDPPGLMFMYTAENCLAVTGSNTQIIYESLGKPYVNVIFDDPSDKLEFVWKESPTKLPDWSQRP